MQTVLPIYYDIDIIFSDRDFRLLLIILLYILLIFQTFFRDSLLIYVIFQRNISAIF